MVEAAVEEAALVEAAMEKAAAVEAAVEEAAVEGAVGEAAVGPVAAPELLRRTAPLAEHGVVWDGRDFEGRRFCWVEEHVAH